jgi:hypothetical protein
MTPERLNEKKLKLTAAVYAKKPYVLEHVRSTGRLPNEIRTGGDRIEMRLLVLRRGEDIFLTPDERLVYDAILRERGWAADAALPVKRYEEQAGLPGPVEPDVQPTVVLPPCPEGFVCHFIDYANHASPPPFVPKQRLLSAWYVGQADWWSDDPPVDGTLDSYFLSTNRHQTLWFLWVNVRGEECDENGIDRGYDYVGAYGPKAKVPPYVAAVNLLMATWKGQRGDECPDSAIFMDGDLLSAAELLVIAQGLWPDLVPSDS